jgi:hypothetical protein
MVDPTLNPARRDAVTRHLLDLAGAREAYETDATFHAQVDMLVIGLPAMVRALAEEVPGRQAAIQAAIDLAKTQPIDPEQAMKLIRETGVMLIDRAEAADPREDPMPPVERRRCVAHGVIACTGCWPST